MSLLCYNTYRFPNSHLCLFTLQYNRESEKKEFDVEDPDARLIEDEVDDDFPKDDRGLQYGIFGGVCEFCGHDIQPFPTLEQQLNFPPDQLFCCDRYREFFDFATTTAFSMAEEQKKKSKMINIKSHGPFSDKKAKKAAQERAEKRYAKEKINNKIFIIFFF